MHDGWVELKGPITAKDLRGLGELGKLEKLCVTKQRLITAEIARGFATIKAARQLWLWCNVTRTAMQYVIAIPGLRVLDVLDIKPPGRLTGFSSATSLEAFHCNMGLSEADLLEVASCQSLRELGIQSATLTPRVLEALLKIPGLQSLDLEGTKFDDKMAARIMTSKSLRSLDIGATLLTRSGVEHLCQMKHLLSLDLWATKITESDVDLLATMPNLEYLSLGGVEGDTTFDAKTLLPRLQAIPSLRRIWLDGVQLSEAQKDVLEGLYTTRIT
jgi:hypothetical protein